MNRQIKNQTSYKFLSFSSDGNPYLSLILSVILHIVLIFGAYLVMKITIDKSLVNAVFVQLNTPADYYASDPLGETQEKPVDEEEDEEEQSAISTYYEFLPRNADTTNLHQIYSETTLNVRVRYPAGWVYIDQDVKNKLDGVTFWMATGAFNPPPYVHLEVKEKYLFNPSRFKYSTKMDNFIAYYNDPEELEGQVSQVVYLRTESAEDYSIKLIMKGEEAFKTFQPEFFGMIKSFRFGDPFF